MRIIAATFVILFTIISCADPKPSGNEMQLTGNVKGLKKGTLILQKLNDTTLVSIDSVIVDGDANYSITAEVESPQIYFLYLRLNNGNLIDERVPFFAEPGQLVLNTSLKAFGNEAVISGSKNQEKLDEYETLISRYTNRNLDIIESQFKARQEGNDSLFSSLEAEQSKLLASKYLATVNFAFNNKDMEVAPYLMLSEVFDANVKYLDTVYQALSTEVKASKYGKDLESLISSRRE